MATSPRSRRALDIYLAARDKAPHEAAKFAREECGGDLELCAEVLGMIEEHSRDRNLDPTLTDPVAEQPAFRAGEVISGRYRIVRFLNRGGMGEVYEAEDLELREHVALKTLLPDIASDGRMISRFKQEIQLSRKVSHPNVCRVFDLARHPADGSAPTTVFLTMEFLPGETLSAMLHRTGRLSTAEALPILTQMADALDAAHAAGVIHRDFKPSNVMLVPGAGGTRAVVTDFGLARSCVPSGEITATLTGALMGTIDYMAPELLTGAPATECSDVYAFGTVAYKMVTGKMPFPADAPLAGAILRSKGPAPSPKTLAADLDDQWERAILRSLDPNPSKRFSRAGDFIAAITDRPAGESARPRKLNRRLILAAVLAAFLLAAAGVNWYTRRPTAAIPAVKTLAILPFRNVDNAAENQSFCEGLTDSLIGRLSQLERFDSSFSVVPMFEFKGRTIRNATDTRQAFNATLAATGSIEHTAEATRMTLKLIDTGTSRQIDSYDISVPVERSAGVLDQAFDHLVKVLQLHVPAASRKEIAAGGTSSAAAFEFCQQGIGLLRRNELVQVDPTIVLFQKALQEDSGYALAYAGLGEAYATKFFFTKDPELARRARLNGERAVTLNDNLAAVHLAIGIIDFRTGRYAAALDDFHRTLALDPASYYSYHWLGRTLDALGKTAEAEQAYQTVVSMRPSYWLAHNGIGAFYYQHGQYAKAEPALRKAIDLAPDNQVSYTNLGGVYLAMGLYDAAEAVLKKSVAMKETYIGDSNLGSAYLMQQHYEEAAAILEKAAKINPNDPRVWRNLGDAYRFGGHAAQSAVCFHKAIDLVEKELSVNAENTEALANLALYWAKLGDPARANAAVKRALAGPGVNADIHFKASVVLILTGDNAAAWQELHAALDAGVSREQVRQEPELAPLRKDSRFSDLIEARGFNSDGGNK